MFWLVLRLRPDVVFTTGAAPGLAAIVCGRAMGAKTIWVDSIANSEQVSRSGRHAGRVAHVWLTQWPALARTGGPEHWGGVV
jgi:UDP-N-acetylglucosamine:LPS N-acetylglucosamine transferase